MKIDECCVTHQNSMDPSTELMYVSFPIHKSLRSPPSDYPTIIHAPLLSNAKFDICIVLVAELIDYKWLPITTCSFIIV